MEGGRGKGPITGRRIRLHAQGDSDGYAIQTVHSPRLITFDAVACFIDAVIDLGTIQVVCLLKMHRACG